MRIAGIVFVVALALRLLFVLGTVQGGTAAEFRRVNGDAQEYLRLAEHAAEVGRYTPEAIDPRIVSVVRTPAYPMLIWGLTELRQAAWPAVDGFEPEPNRDGHPLTTRGIYVVLFFVQAVGGATLAAAAALLAQLIWRSNAAAWAAGLLVACNPTGWGLAAATLTDGPFGVLVGLGLFAPVHAARSAKWWPAVVAGVFWSLAALVKPTILLLPPGLVVIWLLARRGRGRPWRVALPRMAICVGIFLATILGWSAWNHHRAGIFAFSTVSERNLRFMFGPQVEMRGVLGRRPTRTETRDRYYALGHQDLRWVAEPGMTPHEFTRRQREYVHLLFDQFPGGFLQLYPKHLEQNIIGSWDVRDRQLPPDRQELGTKVARLLTWPAFEVEAWKPLRWGLLVAAAGAVVISRRRGVAVAVLLVVCYFVALSGTTHSQGSRILFPAFMPQAVLAAGWVALLAKWVTSYRRS